MRRQFVRNISVLFCGAMLSVSSATVAVTFDWAVIGNAGNAADTQTGYGSVGYEYSIATTEVTNAQYIEFLNAVAKTDTYGLYNTNMGNKYGGITRSGTAGNYSYSLKNNDDNWANRPVVYVSWYDIVRFVNWLNNGQLNGVQDASTTEYGVYDMSLQSTNPASIVRLDGASYWLPNEDEWYKAAYYDPAAGLYYDYATSSDDLPVAGVDANYNTGSTLVPGYFTSEVGEYDNESPYGTYDQSGNVREWTETYVDGYGERAMRGGSFANFSYMMLATTSAYENPTTEFQHFGFRVASFLTGNEAGAIPEPASVGLVLLSVSGLVLRWRKKA